MRADKTSDGPIGVGTRGREARKEGRRESTYEFEVTAFDENTSVAFETTSGPARFSSTYTFDGTGVTMQPKLQMKGLDGLAYSIPVNGRGLRGAGGRCNVLW